MFDTIHHLKTRNENPNSQHGFSLVELLVVVAILAILAAIAIPLFLNQKKKAIQATAQADGNTIFKEILSSSASDITNFGTLAPATSTTAVALSGSTVTITPTAGAQPAATAIVITNVNVSSGSTITSSGFPAGGTALCFAVSAYGATAATATTSDTAVYAYSPTGTFGAGTNITANGLQTGKKACSAAGVAS